MSIQARPSKEVAVFVRRPHRMFGHTPLSVSSESVSDRAFRHSRTEDGSHSPSGIDADTVFPAVSRSLCGHSRSQAIPAVNCTDCSFIFRSAELRLCAGKQSRCSVEQRFSVPVSGSEAHPHGRFSLCLTHTQPTAKSAEMLHRKRCIAAARADVNDRDSFRHFHWTHAPFGIRFCGRSRCAAAQCSGGLFHSPEMPHGFIKNREKAVTEAAEDFFAFRAAASELTDLFSMVLL